MHRIFLAIFISIVLVGTEACGKASQAELDCEEFGRLVAHVQSQMRSTHERLATIVVAPEVCAQWIEATSTRCQQVFYSLAACSRSCDSMPNVSRGECVSELYEVQGACVLPEDGFR